MDPFAWNEPEEPRAMREPVFDGTDPLAIVRSIPAHVPLSPVSAAKRPEWDMRLVIDYVLGASKEAICEEYGLMPHHYDRIEQDIGFLGKVAALKKELEKDGATFTLKAKIQAESLIDVSYKMATDPNTDDRVRAKLIGDTVRWAGLDKTGASVDSTGGFSISINLGGHRGNVIDGESHEL